MKTFTMTQLAQETGMVADAVDLEAATITRRGRPRYVMIRYEEFERLNNRRAKDPRRAIRTADTPDDIRKLLAAEIAEAQSDDEHGSA